MTTHQDQLLRALHGFHDIFSFGSFGHPKPELVEEAADVTKRLFDELQAYEHVTSVFGFGLGFVECQQLESSLQARIEAHLHHIRTNVVGAFADGQGAFEAIALGLDHPLMTTLSDLPYYVDSDQQQAVEYLTFGDCSLLDSLELWRLLPEFVECKILLMHCMETDHSAYHPELVLSRLFYKIEGSKLNKVKYLSLRNNLWLEPWPLFMKEWSELEYLNLRRTSIAYPPGYDLASAHPKLRFLDLSDSGFDPVDVDDLREALPDCTILFET